MSGANDGLTWLSLLFITVVHITDIVSPMAYDFVFYTYNFFICPKLLFVLYLLSFAVSYVLCLLSFPCVLRMSYDDDIPGAVSTSMLVTMCVLCPVSATQLLLYISLPPDMCHSQLSHSPPHRLQLQPRGTPHRRSSIRISR